MALPLTHPPSRSDSLVWPGLCGALALASLWVWVWIWHWGDAPGLAWQSARWPQQPWTLWSSCLVHLSGAHLLANLLALTVLGVLGTYLHAGRACAAAVLLAWPLGTLALVWWPQITGYSGMSGLLNAMAAVLWAHAVMRPDTRPVSFVICAALALKLLGERAWSQPIAFDPNWGFNVVYAAHLAGAVAGAICGLFFAVPGALRMQRATSAD